MDKIDLSRPMQQASFADLVGVSKPAVSAWVKEGRLRRGDTGVGWLRAYLSWLRDEASGRGTENPLTAARARLTQAQAERAELLARRVSGDLIDKTSAARAVHDAFRTLRDSLQRMPRRLSGHVVGLKAEDAERLIAEELRRTLQDFSTQRVPEVGVERMGGNPS